MKGPTRLTFSLLLGLCLALSLLTSSGCGRSHADCSNGKCICDPGGNCSFDCQSPPCHVTCDGDNDCDGVCSNGTCTCGSHSSCDFSCGAPPCHVVCAAQTECHGECANGQCTCGPDSTCDFTCRTSPCHTSCAAGSHCLVRCPAALAGTPTCDIISCGAGTPVVCSGGAVVTCGSPCPQ